MYYFLAKIDGKSIWHIVKKSCTFVQYQTSVLSAFGYLIKIGKILLSEGRLGTGHWVSALGI